MPKLPAPIIRIFTDFATYVTVSVYVIGASARTAAASLVWFRPTNDDSHDPGATHMNADDLDMTADRSDQARENLVNALRECGELADAVAAFQGQELIEVLDYLDSLRFVMAESGQLLAGVVRGEQG